MNRLWLALLLWGLLLVPALAQVPGGGGISQVTDGSHTANGPYQLDFVSGCTVMSVGGVAQVTCSGGTSVLTINSTSCTGCTPGYVLYTDSSGLLQNEAVSGTGTVTSVATGSDLTGGPITTSGTLNLALGTSDSGATFITASTPTIPTTYRTALFDPTSNTISATIQACNTGSRWDQWFKDATGEAAIHLITLTPSAGTIDGSTSAQIGSAYGALHIHSNGGVCVIL